MATPHNAANMGDIAETILLPGDPLRAKVIAETFLENPIDIPRDVMRKKRMKVNSKNALEKSNFELINGEEINKHALEHSSIKLARSIGKEPGE